MDGKKKKNQFGSGERLWQVFAFLVNQYSRQGTALLLQSTLPRMPSRRQAPAAFFSDLPSCETGCPNKDAQKVNGIFKGCYTTSFLIILLSKEK